MNFAGVRRRLPSTTADIVLEAGGDHQFDLRHLRREGAVSLVRLLLQTAGYHEPIPWRVRVEKKIVCGPETRSVSVVGSKPWCCYLKLKPGDNNTGHFCSLLMPDGYRGEAVYDVLKGAEEEVNRVWRNRAGGGRMSDVERSAGGAAGRQAAAGEAAHSSFGPPGQHDVAPAAASPAPDAADANGAEADTSDLLGWTRDADKVRLTLFAIYELVRDGKAVAIDEFVAALTNKLGWHGLRRKQIGAIFATLKRHGQIYKLQRGSIPLGYALTDEGRRAIRELLPAAEVVPPPAAGGPPAAPPPDDPARLAAALGEIARGYATACARLQEVRTRRAQLVAEVERLDAEASALSKVVENPEVRALLQRLAQLTESGGAAPHGAEGPGPGSPAAAPNDGAE